MEKDLTEAMERIEYLEALFRDAWINVAARTQANAGFAAALQAINGKKYALDANNRHAAPDSG